jgi:hypothetical protein
MAAPDLRVRPPRRSSDELGGIRWLPRIIDKLRAARAGTLGPYILCQSPMDRWLLQQLGLSHDDLAEIIAASQDDDGVLVALSARDPQGIERARRWSDRIAKSHRLYFWFVDVDDGYVEKSPWYGTVHASANAISWMAKHLMRSKYDAQS